MFYGYISSGFILIGPLNIYILAFMYCLTIDNKAFILANIWYHCSGLHSFPHENQTKVVHWKIFNSLCHIYSVILQLFIPSDIYVIYAVKYDGSIGILYSQCN